MPRQISNETWEKMTPGERETAQAISSGTIIVAATTIGGPVGFVAGAAVVGGIYGIWAIGRALLKD